MKKSILILLISLFSIVGYGQIVIQEQVTVHTTLLVIDSIAKGYLLKGETLPPALEYSFVADDTLKLTLMPIEDIQGNTEAINQLQEQIDSLLAEIIAIKQELTTTISEEDLLKIEIQ